MALSILRDFVRQLCWRKPKRMQLSIRPLGQRHIDAEVWDDDSLVQNRDAQRGATLVARYGLEDLAKEAGYSV